MARSYIEIKRVVQPLYQRYRNIFRGPRSSRDENLEMNKILIDLKRLDLKIDEIDSNIYENVRIFIGQVDPEAAQIHDQRINGDYYEFDDIQLYTYGDSATPDYLEIPTTITISGRLTNLAHKIKMLESKGNN